MCLAVETSSNPEVIAAVQGMDPVLGTDSEESETDEEPSEDALEYVRVQYYVMHWEVDGVVVILSVVRPPASLTGLIYNIALL